MFIFNVVLPQQFVQDFFSEIIETQIFTPSQVNHDIHCTFGGIQDFHLRK